MGQAWGWGHAAALGTPPHLPQPLIPRQTPPSLLGADPKPRHPTAEWKFGAGWARRGLCFEVRVRFGGRSCWISLSLPCSWESRAMWGGGRGGGGRPAQPPALLQVPASTEGCRAQPPACSTPATSQVMCCGARGGQKKQPKNPHRGQAGVKAAAGAAEHSVGKHTKPRAAAGGAEDPIALPPWGSPRAAAVLMLAAGFPVKGPGICWGMGRWHSGVEAQQLPSW